MSRAAPPSRRAKAPPASQVARKSASRKPGPVDRFEAEARALAAAPLAEGPAPAPQISLAPAAPRLAGLGPGKPLPQHLRAPAEAALGADLAAVRLHDGAAVEAHLGESGLAALTAGADILSRDPRAFEGPAGARLLRHELVHVLQQTGRPGPDGRLRATRRHGTGAAYGNLGPFTGAHAPEPAGLLPHLVATHLAANPSDPDLIAVAARIGRIPSPQGLAMDALAYEAMDGQLTGVALPVAALSQPARALLCDVFKFTDYSERASDLLYEDPLLPTVARLDSFERGIVLLPERRPHFFAGVSGPGTEIHRILTHGMPDAIWGYLMQPGRAVQAFIGLAALKTRAEEGMHDWSQLGHNEIELAALDALTAMQNALAHALAGHGAGVSDWFTGPGAAVTGPLQMRYFLAAHCLQELVGLYDSYPEFVEGINASILRARIALAFWVAVLARLRALGTQVEGADGPETVRLADSPGLARMRAELVPAALALLETPEGAHLPLAEYRRRRTAYEGVMRTLTRDFGAELRALPSAAARAAAREIDGEAAMAGRHGLDPAREEPALLIGVIGRLRAPLLAARAGASGTDAQAADLEHLERLEAAQAALWFAELAQVPRLAARAREALAGRDIGAATLVLITDWQEQPRAPVGQLAQDFPSASGRSLPLGYFDDAADSEGAARAPLSVDALVAVYRLFRDRRLITAITAELSQPIGTTARAEDEPSALARARTLARGAPEERPRRWHVAQAIYTPYLPDGRPAATAQSFRVQLATHHRTRSQLATLTAGSSAVIFPTEFTGEVFAWSIPPLGPVIAVLRDIGRLNEAVAGYLELDPEAARALPPEDWLQALSEWAQLRPERLDLLLDQIDQGLAALQAQEDARLTVLLPQLMSLERRRLARDIAPLLADYATGHIRHFSAPTEVARRIEAYLDEVTPERLEIPGGGAFAQADAQLAVLLLGLSGPVEAAFNPELLLGLAGRHSEGRFDIITRFTPLLRRALAASATPAQHDALAQLMTPAEIAALDITAARTRLQGVLDGFEASAAEMAERLALVSDGNTLGSNLYASTIAPSPEPFMARGLAVKLIRITRPFVFIPAYGRGAGEVHPPQLLAPDRSPIDTAEALVIFQIGEGSEIAATGEMTPENIARLMLLRDIVLDRNFAQSMENLEASIRLWGEVMLTVGEFVPGVGQAITVGRVIYEVAQFLLSDEFDAMLALVRGDPLVLISAMIERMRADLLDPSLIWQYLLFRTSPLDFMPERGGGAERRAPARHRGGRMGRFARIARSIGAIPVALADRIDDVRDRVRPRVISVQGYVGGTPPVAVALLFAARLMHNQTGLAAQLAAMGSEIGDIAAAITGEGEAAEANLRADFEARLGAMLNAIDHFELPQEPIPNAQVIAAMIDFIMERLERMGKFGKGVQITNAVLQTIGAYDEIAAQIARLIAGSAIDPNMLWQTEVLPEITDTFNEARDDFVATANVLLARFGLNAPDPEGRVSRVESALIDTGPEAAPKLAPGDLGGAAGVVAGRTGRGPGALPAIGAGRPLPGPLMARAGAEFGHDFRHVRLHRGSDAAALTGRYGAEALTSGSHVFLRPGLSPERGSGAQVLRHELAHVLQQTGPAPLAQARKGAAAAPLPRLGRPGRGLRLNRAEEAAADRTAAQAAVPGPRGARLAAPLAATPGAAPRPEGLAPMLPFALMADIFERFTEPADVDAFLAALPHTQGATVPGHLAAERIWDDCAAALSENPLRNVRSRLRSVSDQIRTHAHGHLQTLNGNGKARIFALARLAQKPLAHPPTSPNAVTTELDLRAFVNLLEALIFAEMGLIVEIRFTELPTPAVQRLSIKSLDLGRVTPITAPLWETFFTNTAPHHLGHNWAANGYMRRLVYEIAQMRRPEDQLLDSRSFSMHRKFWESLELLLTHARAITPLTWAQYMTVQAGNPAHGVSDTQSDRRHKLRLGTHGELTGPFNVTNRDSHHMPQFLFVEYFTNKATTKLFDPVTQTDRLPGFEAGSHPGRFSRGSSVIDFGALDPNSGRGDNVPAISLASRTHQTGRLHIGGSAAWPGDAPPGQHEGQSGQISAVFRTFAMSELTRQGITRPGTNLTSDFTTMATAARAAAAPAGGRADAMHEAVHQAMRKTYRWMYYEVMRPALERALRTEEPRFYLAAMVDHYGTAAIPADHDPRGHLGPVGSVMRQIDAAQRVPGIQEFI